MIDVLNMKEHLVAKWVAIVFNVLAVCVLVVTLIAVIQWFEQPVVAAPGDSTVKSQILLEGAIRFISGMAAATLFVFFGQAIRYLASSAAALSEIFQKMGRLVDKAE